MAEVVINWERAESVFGTLLEALRNEKYPYDVAKPPQRRENLPPELEWGSVAHARFLFCVCYYMRGGIRSDTAILALGRVYQNHPRLFEPEYFVKPDSNPEALALEVKKVLQGHALNYQAEEVGRHWVYNFRKLHKFWKGDPSELFTGVQNYDEACQRIMRTGRKSEDNPNGFFGFRYKMVSMLIHFLMDANTLKPFMFPVPVDFHVLRVMIIHRLLEVPGLEIGEDLYSPELLAAARELSAGYCEKHGVDPLRLGDTLWLLSRTLCQLHPGNSSRVGRREGRRTILSQTVVVWNEPQLDRYDKACGQCPVRGTCEYNVAAANYYVQGALVVRGRRDHPLLLFNRES